MPAIGKLDRRIVVQRATTTQDPGTGETISTWGDLATLWAERTDVSDTEKYAAGTILSTKLSRFVVRSTPVTRDIQPTDRLAYAGQNWGIDGIKETREGRNRFLEITAMAGS